LLAIDNRGTLLALERSFVVGVGNTIKIYEISLQGATDISTIDALNSLSVEQLAAIQPAQKRLVLDLTKLNLPNSDGNHPTGLDNIEGLAFGPKLADGRQSIVLVSDNNFGATQFTQILTLSADLVPTVTPRLETPSLLDNDEQDADADDPAIYLHPTDSAKSLVLTSVKNGGLRVYDLAGKELQTVNPGNIRYNNIDLQYGFTLGGQEIDLAVASDRNNDKLAIFKINPNATNSNYLEDITDSNLGTIFQALPFAPEYSPSERSAYGLALYRSPLTFDYYVFVNRRETGDVAQLKLIDQGNGKIGAERIRNFTVTPPAEFGSEVDPQTEGMVVDQETGYLYIGQENVGIWKFAAEPTGNNNGVLVDKIKEFGGSNLVDDVEGLTIYYGADGKGYLLVSSQGDNTFAVYRREGNNEFIGRFGVGNNGAIDSVQESDGADVINVPLGPNFPFGLFVTQDGNNDPAVLVEDDGELENINSNFKFVPWENIANALPQPLIIDPTSYNPRNPENRVNYVAPFPNGVASGDTTQTSTVLWTLSGLAGDVIFSYSSSPNFSNAVQVKVAATNSQQPVKAKITGLTPGTQYYYTVTDPTGTIVGGQFKTSAAAGTKAGLRFGVSGDWRGELSPYPGLANAPQRNLEFFLKLGDTIYADYASPAVKNPDGTEKEQVTTLDEYRAKYAEVYGTRYGLNTWALLRGSTSVLATIDDHEVVNDFQGGEDLANASAANKALFGASSGLVNDSPLYEIGLQAFQEYHPLSDQFYGQNGDDRTAGERKLYRYNTYGSDAATFVLDARSFRDPGLPGVANPNDPNQIGNFLAQSFNPSRTMLGKVQVEELKQDLLKAQQAGITWKFVIVPEPIQNLGVVGASDRFEGYAAERTEILKFINDNKISNVVFIAADIHGTVVNNLTYQLAPGQAQIATSAFEITTGSLAFDAPFGPTVIELGGAAGVVSSQQQAFYNNLPVANDADSTLNDKDDFVKQLLNNTFNSLGYDPVGLNNNLSIANGLINAKLLQGDYLATHTYGWTEFDIDPVTQKLTVTTYGIDDYTRAELEANPQAITSRQPQIVSQFEVTAASNDQITFPPTKLNKIGNDVLRVDGGFGQPKLQVTLTGRSSQAVNELGVFTVDDAEGRINGIAPGAAGYTQAALARAKVIFSAIANLPNGFDNNNAIRKLSYEYGDRLRFYLVKDGSTDAINNNTTSSTEIVFSSSSSQQITDLGNDGFTLAWNSSSGSVFQDLVVKVQATTDTSPLGTNLQGQAQGEVIDLRNVSGAVRADFTVNREAAFNNYVGFYRVTNPSGGIDTNGDGNADILPGQAGYIQAAVQNRIAGIDLTVNNQGTASFTGTLQGGSIFAPFIIVNGRPDALLDTNTSNDPAVYFSYLGANSDRFDHVRLLGDNVFGFEDLPNGGDRDFNDVIVKVNLTPLAV
jgi:3-phytase/alkaline phosphatase D